MAEQKKKLQTDDDYSLQEVPASARKGAETDPNKLRRELDRDVLGDGGPDDAHRLSCRGG